MSYKIIQYVHLNEAIINEIAHKQCINLRNLELQVLLHLPRLIDEKHLLDFKIFVDEVRRLSTIIKRKTRRYKVWQKLPSRLLSSPRNTRFIEVPKSEARIIHERFHYLSSYRLRSLHFGLRALEDNRLISLLTLSPFDLDHIVEKLPSEIDDSSVLVASRIYSFAWAPKNSISYMMSRVFKWIKQKKPNIKMLITYINPNMGFTGTSYKASEWVFFGCEWGTRYTYLGGKYITDRELKRRYGTADPKALGERLGAIFEVSKIKLVPLWLYVYFLDKEMRRIYDKGFDHNFWRL